MRRMVVFALLAAALVIASPPARSYADDGNGIDVGTAPNPFDPLTEWVKSWFAGHSDGSRWSKGATIRSNMRPLPGGMFMRPRL